MTQRHAPPCLRRTEVAANASGTLRRGRFSASHSKKYGLFGILPLDIAKKGDILMRIGLGTPGTKRQSQPSTAAYSRKTKTCSACIYEPAGRASARRVFVHVFQPGRLSLYRELEPRGGLRKKRPLTKEVPVKSLSFHRRSGVVVTLDLAPHRNAVQRSLVHVQRRGMSAADRGRVSRGRSAGAYVPYVLFVLFTFAAGAFAAIYGGAR